jgi:hypothetical protein
MKISNPMAMLMARCLVTFNLLRVGMIEVLPHTESVSTVFGK